MLNTFILDNTARPLQEHSLFRNISNPFVSYLPTHFLLKFANPYPLKFTDNAKQEMVTLEELWQELQTQGMHDPFILRVCLLKKTIRLETGNQRIRLFEKHGIDQIPVIIEIAATPIGSRHNGDQLRPLLDSEFDIKKLKDCNTVWCNPADVIRHPAVRVFTQRRATQSRLQLRHHQKAES